MNKKDCVLSIIITAHREGLVAHKTMKSVERAVKKIEEASISYEVIVSIDRLLIISITIPACLYTYINGIMEIFRVREIAP